MVNTICGECGADRTKLGSISYDVDNVKATAHLIDGRITLERVSGKEFQNATCVACGYQTLGNETFFVYPFVAPIVPVAGDKEISGTIPEALAAVAKDKGEGTVAVPRSVVSKMDLAMARAETALAKLTEIAEYEKSQDAASTSHSGLQRLLEETLLKEHSTGRRARQAIKEALAAVEAWNAERSKP